MKILYTIVFLIIVNFLSLSKAESKPVHLFLDYSIFALDDSSSLFEMYYSFIDTSLLYTKNLSRNTFIGEAIINVVVKNKNKTIPVIDILWKVEQMNSKGYIDTLSYFVGQKNFKLEFGEYTVTVRAFDQLDSNNVKEYTFTIFVPKYNVPYPQLSDIQLASDIFQVGSSSNGNNTEFHKSGALVVPNPSLEIISTTPTLKFYSEVYNTNTIVKGNYTIIYKIANSLNQDVVSIPVEKKSTNDAIVLSEEIPLEILPSGIYYFYIQLQYSRNDSNFVVEKRKKFYLINSEMLPSETNEFVSEDDRFLQSEFSTLTESETEIEIEKIKILIPKNQVDVLKSLTETKAKQKFLFQYWSQMDSDLLTSVNEELENFKENVRYANKFYKNPLVKEGWRSDRGRVRLKYGTPTQIDLRVAGSDSRPHEIWFYQAYQGGVIFVFVEIGGVNRYVQVHSNHFNELHEENWYERFARLSK